jgi:diguanylate cyclase (GGDEF)-like protein
MAGKGCSNSASPVGLRFPIPGDTPNTRVIEERVPIVLDDAPTAYSIFTEAPHSHIRSWMGVPLMVHDRVIGMLALDHEQPNFYDDQLVALAESFANQVAISLENARLFDDQRRRVQELDALRTTIADITGELALPSLSRAIIERATALLGAAGGELGLYDPDNEKITILVSYQMAMDNAGIIIDMGEGLMGHVAEIQETLRIDDYQVWAGQSEKYQGCKIHGAIAAPLMIRRRFLGVLGIMTTDPKQKFTTSDLNLLSLFAQQAAIAVENAQLFEEKERQVRTDALTSVYNRRGLSEFGQRELDRAYRYDRLLAAIMLDIDNFKIINDTHGHPIGDLILIELADRLANNLRELDILVRYGGEEFAILLPETSLENAALLAERLRESVANLPFCVNALTLEVTISLGVAGKSEKKQALNDLLSQADQAMYQAKDSGRNCVRVC